MTVSSMARQIAPDYKQLWATQWAKIKPLVAVGLLRLTKAGCTAHAQSRAVGLSRLTLIILAFF